MFSCNPTHHLVQESSWKSALLGSNLQAWFSSTVLSSSAASSPWNPPPPPPHHLPLPQDRARTILQPRTVAATSSHHLISHVAHNIPHLKVQQIPQHSEHADPKVSFTAGPSQLSPVTPGLSLGCTSSKFQQTCPTSTSCFPQI